MFTKLWLPGFLFFSLAVMAQTPKKQISLDDLWLNGTFKVKDVPGFNAMKDGLHYTSKVTDGGYVAIGVYSLESGKQEKNLFDNKEQPFEGHMLNPDDYVLSDDEKKMVLLTDAENIYRRSILHHAFVLDIGSGKITQVDTGKVLHATLSPDALKIAFVKDNNLFIKELSSGKVLQVTRDGVKNKIINGNCDWVYEEEFSFTRAFDWSADSKYLAYYRFDESQVPEYTIAKYSELYPEQYTYKYPKAGERNSDVQIYVFDMSSGKSTKCDVGNETDQYIPRIKWTGRAGELCIYRLNRHQNHLDLLAANVKTGKSDIIYTEENKYFLDISDEIAFLPDGHGIILRSDKGGYSHLYHYNRDNKTETDITPGNYDIDALTGVDLAHKCVYYTSAELASTERNLYVVGWNGQGRKNLTPMRGFHSITPCAGYRFFLDKFTTINTPPVYNLIDANGKVVRVLEDNHDLQQKMNEYALGNVRMIPLKGVEETLNGWIITPPDFDSTKKYPVLLYQYSGPGSQEVAERFPLGNFFWHQMLAEKGYIVICADGTGTGFRGEAFRKKTYLQLGKYESDDQIAVAKYLGGMPWVDKNRIGIWGWSFGGFMSSNCILKGNDVFKMAIAVAPVTNWRFYDNIYTERYMRTPQENEEGYDSNAPEKIAGRLKGKFLFIHGTADDNVHFQNSVMLAKSLINAGKEFESEYYPDKAHGIGGAATRLHLYHRMTDFILNNL